MTTTAIKAAAGSQTGKNGSAGTGAAAGAPLVLVGPESGITLIPQPTELTRLNYYDGKFLRAADLNAEQAYLRSLVALSNRAGGAGVVHGFDVTRAGTGNLGISAGLAVDPRGRVVWMPYDASVSLAQLIERSREAQAAAGAGPAAGAESFGGCAPESVSAQPPGGTGLQSTDLYLITVAWAEALCGEADVYGKLCEDACVTSTDRPFRLEGVVVRAVPVSLGAATCTASWLTTKHRRSLVASAWFEDERRAAGAAMSGARIRNGPWCVGATAATGDSVPLAVVSVNGGTLQFLDEWTARRERIEMPPLRYWQWQLAMRPKAVFLAQLLQFQCQLRDVLTETPLPGDGGNDPCSRQRELLRQTQKLLTEVQQQYRAAVTGAGGGGEGDVYRPEFMASLGNLRYEVGATLTQLDAVEQNRVLLEAGIVETPPAGYLTVVPGPVDVKTQVQRLLGEGVELRVCSVRPDFVPHALEEAQHMERICLLRGLEDPEQRQKVDVLVPDGVVSAATVSVGGIPLQVKLRFEAVDVNPENPDDTAGDVLLVAGAGRAELLDGGGAAFHFAGRGELSRQPEDLPQVVQPAPGTSFGGQTGVAVPAKDAATGSTVEAVEFASADAQAVLARARGADDAQAQAQAQAAPRQPRAGFTGEGLRRMFTRASAQEKTASARGGVSGYQTAPPPPPPPAVAEPKTADFSPSVWASVRVGGNPFELAIGDSVPLHGEFAMSFEEGHSPPTLTAAEVVIDAELYRDQDAGSTLTGRARGFAVVRTPGHAPESGFESFPVRLSMQPAAGGGGTLTAEINAFDDSRLRFVTTWSPQPTTVKVDGDLDWISAALHELEHRDGDTSAARRRIEELEKSRPELHHLPFLQAAAVEDPEVLKSGNPHHERAVAALTDLQELLKEPGFRAAGEVKLFAPDRQVEAASSIRATRDWVLFHRRRDNSCDCTCAHDETQVLRRYRLYHVQAPEGTTLDEIRRALAGTAQVEGMSTVPVLPRYAADGTALLSTRREVLDAWREMDLGTEIVYGVVAAAGAGSADAGALLDARLEALGALLDDVTPAPHAVYETLPAVPPSLSDGGVDGVMVLVTQARAPRTVCHEVYALPDQGTMDGAVRLAKAGSGLGTLLKESSLLGTVTFPEGGGTPTGPLSPLLDAWNKQWPEAGVSRALTVVPGGTSVPGWAAPQGTAVAAAFGVNLTEGALGTLETGVGACPALTLLEPGQPAPPATTCHELFRMRPGWTMPRLAKVNEQGEVGEELSTIAVPLGVFHFQEGSTTPVEDAAAIKAAWTAQGPGTPEFGATFSTAAAGSTQYQAQIQQGMALNQAVGGPAHSNQWPVQQPISTGCDVATLIAEQPIPRVHRVYRVVNEYISPDYAWNVVKNRILQGMTGEDALNLDSSAVTYLGDVSFVDGTTDVLDGNVAELWNNQGGGFITTVGSIYSAARPEGWKEVLRGQSLALGSLAGGSDGFEGIDAAGVVNVAALTVLITPPNNSFVPEVPSGPVVDCHTVYRFSQAMSSDDVTTLRKMLQDPDGFTKVLARSDLLGRADFDLGGAAPTEETAQNAASWKGEPVSTALTVIPAENAEQTGPLASERTEWIVAAAGASEGYAARAPVRVEKLAQDCGAMTLLFFVDGSVA